MSVTRTIALLAALFAGCATAPSTRAEQQSLQTSARATLDEMIAQDARIGAVLGGQSFSELLVLRTPDDVASVKSGNFTAGAHLGIVVLSASAGTQTNFNPNASIFVLPRGGLMVDVSISGQRIKYQPLSA